MGIKPSAKIFILSGPSGSGKTTLHERLLKLPGVKGSLIKPVSVTTRPLRGKERNNIDYVFLGRKEFLKRIGRREFLESQSVFGYLYGTLKKTVKEILSKGTHVLLCIDVKGALAVKKIYKKAVMIFIAPPSFKILERRLTNRLTENRRELKRRLLLAKKEMGYMKHYDYIVVNDHLNKAVRELKAIYIAEQSCH